VYFAVSLVLYISCWKVKSGMTSDPVKQYKNLDYNLCSNLSVSGFRIINVISVHETFKIYSTSNSDQPMMKAADHISLKTFQEKKISCRCLGQVKMYFLTLFHPKIELLQLKNLPKEDFVIFVLECGSLQLGMENSYHYFPKYICSNLSSSYVIFVYVGGLSSTP